MRGKGNKCICTHLQVISYESVEMTLVKVPLMTTVVKQLVQTRR